MKNLNDLEYFKLGQVEPQPEPEPNVPEPTGGAEEEFNNKEPALVDRIDFFQQ
jgi:hypothetical protein